MVKSAYAKRKKKRFVKISSELENVLLYIKNNQPGRSKIMSSLSKFQLRNRWINLRCRLNFYSALDEQSGEELTIRFHDLRHQYAIYLRDSGISMVDIQHLLGHSSLRSTEKHYANTAKQIDQDVVNKIHELLPLNKIRG